MRRKLTFDDLKTMEPEELSSFLSEKGVNISGWSSDEIYEHIEQNFLASDSYDSMTFIKDKEEEL